MTLPQWIDRAGREPPRLEESLLRGRAWRYVGHRLRMVAAMRGLELVVHLIEFWLLVQVWSGARLAGAVVAHSAAAIAAAAWWGCLEILRAEVRALGARRAPAEVGRWLRAAALAGGGIAAATALGLAVAAARGRLGPFELYLGLLALRAAADGLLRAYQAGIQATRRIHRPLAAVAAVELAGLAVLAGGLPLLGPWCVPLAIAVSASLSRAVAFHYARRAYRLARVEPPRLRAGRRRAAIRPGAILWAALAGAGSRIGSMLVIAMVAAGGFGDAALALHLVAPLLALTAAGGTAFYIDVVRLGRPLERRLGARMSAALLHAALAIAIAAWSIAAAILAVAGSGRALPLLPLFIAQSLFSLAELELVARGRFRAAAAVAALFAAAAIAGGGGALVLVAAVASGVAYLAVRAAPVAGGWLDELARWRGPVAIGRATLAKDAAPAGALRALEERLGARGRVALCGRRAVWFERERAERLDRCGAAIATAGLAADVEIADAGDGAAAAARVVREGWLADRIAPPPSPCDLLAEFTAGFPDGIAIDLRGGRAAPPPLSAEVAQAVWRDALLFARGGRARRSRFEVSALVEAGAIAIVFAVPRRGPGAARRAFALRARAASDGAVLAALHAPGIQGTYLDGVLPAPHG